MLNLGSENKLRIQVKELLFDDEYFSTMVNDRNPWFTRTEVLDNIHNQYFFTANSSELLPTISHCFQHLAPQTVVLAAVSIHRLLSEYASRKKATVMFSQNENCGTLCTSPVLNFTPKASARIDHTFVDRLIPRLHGNSARIGSPPSLAALLSLDWCTNISLLCRFLLFQCSSAGITTC